MRISCRQQEEDCPAFPPYGSADSFFSAHGFITPVSSTAALADAEAVFGGDDIFREKESAR